jgi:hypothetical protein
MSLNRRKLVALQRLLVGDANRQIIGAPGAGFALRIFRVIASCVTSAAQQIDVGTFGGGVTAQIMSIPSGATIAETWESEEGFLQAANTAFGATPVAAGPAWHFIVEYQIEKL